MNPGTQGEVNARRDACDITWPPRVGLWVVLRGYCGTSRALTGANRSAGERGVLARSVGASAPTSEDVKLSRWYSYLYVYQSAKWQKQPKVLVTSWRWRPFTLARWEKPSAGTSSEAEQIEAGTPNRSKPSLLVPGAGKTNLPLECRRH